MESRNNIKYKIVSGIIVLVCLELIYFTFWGLNIMMYENLDITNMSKTCLRTLSILLLMISSLSLYNAFKVAENGVSYKFNKFMGIIFIIYALFAMISFICIRSSEEEIAMQMQSDIESYSETLKQETLNNHQIKSNNTFASKFAEDTANLDAELEYANNDEFYERKREIIKQVQNSSKIRRYIASLIFDFNYEYYGEIAGEPYEVKYYRPYLEMFIIGIGASAFYFINSREKQNNIWY